MEETHQRQDCAGSVERCLYDREREQEETQEAETSAEETKAGESATCYVLMNSAVYGTEAWPCTTLDAALQTLCRLARRAEQRRQTDGIQRYFCIKGRDLPSQEEPVGREPVRPDLPDVDALALTLHRRETCPCPMSQEAQERDMREVVRLLCQEDEDRERAAVTTANAQASEVGA